MGSIRKIEEAIRNKFNVAAGPVLHDRVFARVRQAKAQSETTPAPHEPALRRMIMSSPITRLAIAAALIVAVGVAISEFGGTNGHGSTALGDMVRNMQQMPWVHYTVTPAGGGENLREFWLGFDPVVIAFKLKDGKLSYRREKEGTEFTFDPQQGVIYAAQVPDLDRPQETFPDSPVAFLETGVHWLDREASSVTRKTAFRNGQETEIIRGEIRPDKHTRHRVELTRDVRQNLLLSMKDVDCADDSKSLMMTCDYPSAGPQSIYDLGAPAAAKIVSLSLPPDIAELIRKLDTLRKTHLTRYVAVSVPTGTTALPVAFAGHRPQGYFTKKDDQACAIWRNGEDRCQVQGYLSPAAQGTPTVEQVARDPRQIAASLMPVAANIFRGDEPYVIYRFQLLNGARIRTRDKQGPVESTGSQIFPELIGWPQIFVPQSGPVQWRTDSVAGPGGENLILIERRHLTVQQWFLNPARDFLCQKREVAQLSDGSIFLSIEILEYAQTPTGQWYPRRLQKTQSSRVNGQETTESFSRDLFLQEKPQFPPDVFDPACLPRASE